MNLLQIIAAADYPKFEPYKVAIDPQFVIPVFYLVPLLICYLLRKYSPKTIAIIVGIIFTASSAYLAFILYRDDAIWKFVMPTVAALGGLSGMSGWIRLLLKKVKNIGDDDSYLK